MAADITASLRAIDPVDPVRFDFSICHVGMMGSCGFRMKQGDTQCPLRGFCRPKGRDAEAMHDARGAGLTPALKCRLHIHDRRASEAGG